MIRIQSTIAGAKHHLVEEAADEAGAAEIAATRLRQGRDVAIFHLDERGAPLVGDSAIVPTILRSTTKVEVVYDDRTVGPLRWGVPTLPLAREAVDFLMRVGIHADADLHIEQTTTTTEVIA